MNDRTKIVTVPIEPRTVAKRMLFLAYNASRVVGMGVLQARPGVTEEEFASATYHEEGRNLADPQRARLAQYYVDYGFGRMMKLLVEYDTDGVLVLSSTPNSEYQSWCTTYPTYQSLAEAAIASLMVAS